MRKLRALAGPKTTKWVVIVQPIAPAKYPEYQAASDHPFAGVDPDKRISEFDSACARLWVRACEEVRIQPLITNKRNNLRHAA